MSDLRRDVPQILAVALALAEMGDSCATYALEHEDGSEACRWWHDRATDLLLSADQLRQFAGSVA